MKAHPPINVPEARLKELQKDLEVQYPDFTVGCTGTKICIRGSFPVLHQGTVLDRYQIEIEWSDSDTEVPLLRETGGRIPWIADRHMNLGGIACLFVPEEWLLRPREDKTIIRYLEGPVRDYFLWQSLYERGESPPWKDRAHGLPGLIEAYGDIVGMESESAVRCCLKYLSKDQIKGHWPCPCGSGKRTRECHLKHMRELKSKVPRLIAQLALIRLSNPTIR
jgi:hypothetical protein